MSLDSQTGQRLLEGMAAAAMLRIAGEGDTEEVAEFSLEVLENREVFLSNILGLTYFFERFVNKYGSDP